MQRDPLAVVFLIATLIVLLSGIAMAFEIHGIATVLVIAFLLWCRRAIDRAGPHLVPYASDPEGPHHGWDQRTVAAAQRRSNGIE